MVRRREQRARELLAMWRDRPAQGRPELRESLHHRRSDPADAFAVLEDVSVASQLPGEIARA
jgi:hypothetical protein